MAQPAGSRFASNGAFRPAVSVLVETLNQTLLTLELVGFAIETEYAALELVAGGMLYDTVYTPASGSTAGSTWTTSPPVPATADVDAARAARPMAKADAPVRSIRATGFRADE